MKIRIIRRFEKKRKWSLWKKEISSRKFENDRKSKEGSRRKVES